MRKMILIIMLLFSMFLISCNQKEVHTVRFALNSESILQTQEVDFGTNVIEPTTPMKDDYVFVGWYSDSSFNFPYNFSNPVTGDLTLYAKWESTIFNVTFLDWDEETLGNATFSSGTSFDSVIFDIEPVRNGYNFSGWRNLPDIMPNENITVTANYISYWDVFVNFMSEYGTAETEDGSLWYTYTLSSDDGNEYEIKYGSDNYEDLNFNISMYFYYPNGTYSSNLIILDYGDVFSNHDYFYFIYDSGGTSIGYGMGPNSTISGINPEAVFSFGNLSSSWIEEAEDMIVIMVDIFTEFFEQEIEIPFS